jgi:acyl-CoA synthetase (AMP-forming)/AMP-acid ligase II
MLAAHATDSLFGGDVVSALSHWSINAADRSAFVFVNSRLDEVDRITFAELHQRARVLADLLRDRANAEDRALLIYPAGIDFIVALFACFYAGVVAVPVSAPRTGGRGGAGLDRLAAVTADCSAHLIMTDSGLAGLLRSKAGAIPKGMIVLETDTVPRTLAFETGYRPPAQDAVAFLQYTSGSTGTPKGAVVRHANLAANLLLLDHVIGHDPASAWINWLPHHHDMGLIANTIYPALIGTTCYLMAPVTFVQRPIRWLEAISRYRATTSSAPNFAYDLSVRRTTPEDRAGLDLSSWTFALNAAEPVRAATLDRFTEAFEPFGFSRQAFSPCYGLAEATVIVTGVSRLRGAKVRNADSDALAAGSLRSAAGAGQAVVGSGSHLPGYEMLIVDPETCSRLPDERIGEIWLAGPSVVDGYWGAAGKEMFQGFTNDGAGPFLRTGDLGGLWDGELFVTGRLKDLIIIDGRNHYPQDIELTVETAHPLFRLGGSAAFAVDTDEGEQIVVAAEIDRAGRANPATILTAARQAVAEQHDIPLKDLALLLPGELPRTTSGKVRRQICRQQYLAGQFNRVAI